MTDSATPRDYPNVPMQGVPERFGRSPGALHRPSTRTASVEMLALSSLFVYGVLIFVLLLTGFISWTLISILIVCKRVFSYLLAWSDQTSLTSREAVLSGLNPAWAALSPMGYLWMRTKRTAPDFSGGHRPMLIYLACLIFGFCVFAAVLSLSSALPKP